MDVMSRPKEDFKPETYSQSHPDGGDELAERGPRLGLPPARADDGRQPRVHGVWDVQRRATPPYSAHDLSSTAGLSGGDHAAQSVVSGAGWLHITNQRSINAARYAGNATVDAASEFHCCHRVVATSDTMAVCC